MFCMTTWVPISRACFLHSWQRQLSLTSPPIRRVGSNRHQLPKSSYPAVTTFSLAQKWQKTTIWRCWSVSLLVGAALAYDITRTKPLKLERGNDKELLGADDISQRYLPPIVPYTIDQANAALRWEQSSQICGQGSGVLRFDTARLPSNMPCEDEMLSASGYEDDEIKWLMWALFDGHA